MASQNKNLEKRAVLKIHTELELLATSTVCVLILVLS